MQFLRGVLIVVVGGAFLMFALFGSYALYKVQNQPRPVVEYRVFDNGGTGTIKADEIRIEGPCVILLISGKAIAYLCNHDIAIIPNHEEPKQETAPEESAAPSGFGTLPESTVASAS